MVDKAPETLKELANIAHSEPRFWTLWYRFGTVPIATKSFIFDGNLQEATTRARKHCEIMKYRYVFVKPMIVDLDYQEELFIAGKYREPNAPSGTYDD